MVQEIKKIKSNQVLLFLLVIIVVVILLLQQDFFGGFIISCDNFEPKSFSEFTTNIQSLSGSITVTDSFIIPKEDDVLEKYSAYESESSLGNIVVIPLENMTCNSFLERVNEHPYYDDNLDLTRSDSLCIEGYAVVNNMCVYNNCWSSLEDVEVYENLSECNEVVGHTTTSFVNLQRRQVLSVPDEGYLFCNYENNLALLVPDVDTLSNYVENFEVCTETESKKDSIDENESNETSDRVDEDDDGELDVQEPVVDSGSENEPSSFIAGFNAKVFNTVLVVVILLLLVFFILRKKKVL